MRFGLTRKELERRIVGDLLIGAIALILFGCAVHFLHFLETLAQWTGRVELVEIDRTVLAIIYAIWLFGIFSLRRQYELRSVVAERSKMESRVYETQKTESLAKMATGIAHDFNNLLVAITGFCDLALERPDVGAAVRQDLNEIKQAGDRADSLVKRLMAFARKKPPETRVLDINEIVSDMAPILQHLVGDTVRLNVALIPEPCCVKANLTQMEEILVNLALNAHEAMPEGGNITFETSKVDLDKKNIPRESGIKPGNYVKLSVGDTGYGIDPKIRDQIFEAFFTTREKGTGLGLSMVSGIVKQSSGSIEVDSVIDKGTTFHIYLPRVEESGKTESKTLSDDRDNEGSN